MVLTLDRLDDSLRQAMTARRYVVANLDDGSVSIPEQLAPFERSRICLLTSGTTGRPKIVPHTWSTLFTMAKVRALPGLTWLLTYREGTYAWFQLLNLALYLPSQSLVVPERRDASAMFESAVRSFATAISAPPTFWRLLLMRFPREDLRRLQLQQITLGGERVDQAIIDALHELYPKACITHIYASTEAGGCIVVRDQKEGFPLSWIDESSVEAPSDRPALRLRNGHLWIKSPYGSSEHQSWFDSGDAAEIRGERVVILGRADRSIVKVGGLNVALCDVEHALLGHSSILWCRARGIRAPLAGELVAVELVCRANSSQPSEEELTRFCAAKMAEHMVPRHWTFLPSIPITDNFKASQNS